MKIIIAGGGMTGTHLASILLSQGHQVRLIEHRPDVLSRLHLELPTEAIYEDNPLDLHVLEDAGIRDADVLVTCLRNDADNLVLCYLAHTLYQVPRIVSRINDPRHAWLFDEKLHVDVAINESDIMAHLIAEEITSGDLMTLLKLSRGRYSLVEEKIHPKAPAAGKAIRDLNLPSECVLCAILREDEMLIPRGDLVLHPADEVLAIVPPSQLGALAGILGMMSEDEVSTQQVA